jgi:ectoine hydroxylase-related dioxygenase (phytanoyl-CoA dioxygenase family)
MEIGNWKATPHLNNVYREIRRLDLERNVAELDTYGFTILEPGRAAPMEFVDRLVEKILEVEKQRKGRADGTLAERPVGELVYHLLFENRVFEEAVLNPVALALITYLLGENCVLSSLTGGIKAETSQRLVLHSDNGMVPSPFPPYAQVANATWVLSDYTKEGGCLLFVPGSHHLCRHPTPSEVLDEAAMVPIEVPRGSMVVWHGNLWHGAFPKRTPGLRFNLIMLYCRMYMQPQEPLRYLVSQEILDRNPPRFAKLVGQHIAYGWKADGPQWTPDSRKYLGLERTPDERLFD